MKDNNTYLPLPDCVTIRNSEIHGLGLFSTKDIAAGTLIGITHVRDDRFQDGYIRTPLGGFFNHSDIPNCEAIQSEDFILLKTTKEILAGEELTAFYWLYRLK